MRVRREAVLGTLGTLDVGTAVELPMPDGTSQVYYSVGTAAAPVAARLGWTQHNVWLRDAERRYILSQRGALFPDLERAIAHLLSHPQSVHEDKRWPRARYFVASGEALRRAKLMAGSAVALVDAAIETRLVRAGRYLRVLHFSPTASNKGGKQLWP